jgi:septal ring factor EnvC (AmiA/AmiB activator)
MENHMAWLRQHMRDHIADSGPIDQIEKVFPFPKAPVCSPESEGEAALELVYRAAEVIRGIEDRASVVEARARSLAEDAVEKLQVATNCIESLETGRRETEKRIQETESALERAEARIAAGEDQLSQAELRARTAETRASEAEKALIRIEDAIRTHLLGQRRGVSSNLAVAA